MPTEVRSGTGWGVLHLFLRVDRELARGLPDTASKDLAATLNRLAADDAVQVHLFAGLGHKADMWVMALAADLADLRRVQTEIAISEFGPALDVVSSYVSLTETSEYTPTVDDERARLTASGVSGGDLDRRLGEFAERMATYTQHRLYPQLPAWRAACFYPMSHRRDGATADTNWYLLPFERRRDLMHDHGKTGRAFTGRVLQLVSGSVGLDDWEWGVTLFAEDVGDLKQVVYEMRFDEASATYAEFGPFVLGLRRDPDELVEELGLS